MPRFIDIAQNLIARFKSGVIATEPAGLDFLRRVLTAEDFQLVTTALQVEADQLQAVDMVDSLISTRRHDDRTNLIEEIAFKGGWRRDEGDAPSEMYLNYMVIITNPKPNASLDDQRNVAMGIPIQAKRGNGKVLDVYTPRDSRGKPFLVGDKTTHQQVDFVQYLREEDFVRAGLEIFWNDKQKDDDGEYGRPEWPVVKCRLKPHFMMACMVLSFDKLANLAWQGAYRRGALTKQDAEKMYVNLNWVGPVKKKDLAGYYVMMMHSGIGPVVEWPQWSGLTLGGETFNVDNRRFHTYGQFPVGNQSPQWAILNWIVEHEIHNWNSTVPTPVQNSRGRANWKSLEFLEFAKDDLVYWGYDIADNAALEKVRLDVAEGDASVLDGDNLIKMTGKTLGVYSHRPPEVRERFVQALHIAVSNASRDDLQVLFDRESITRADVNKFYDPDKGAFHRYKPIQAARWLADLSLLDGIQYRYFTNPQLGLAGIGEASRSGAMRMVGDGYGKHLKTLTPYGTRVSWESLLRQADGFDQIKMYDLTDLADGRIMSMGQVIGFLSGGFGLGYGPNPECASHILGDGHAHSTVRLCEAAKPGETPQHHYLRVALKRRSALLYMGLLTIYTDAANFLEGLFAHSGEHQNEIERLKERLKLIGSGKANAFLAMAFSDWKVGASAEKENKAYNEALFGAYADYGLPAVESDYIEIAGGAADEAWTELHLYAFTYMLRPETRAKIKAVKDEEGNLKGKIAYLWLEFTKEGGGGYFLKGKKPECLIARVDPNVAVAPAYPPQIN